MSLSETENGDVSEEKVGSGKVKKSLKQSMKVGLSKSQNGDRPEKTVGSGKVKKSLKQSMNKGLSEAQNRDISKEKVENVKVKISPKKSTILTNGEAAVQSPNSELKKKKKKKKRKMVGDHGPGKYFISEFKLFKLFFSYHSSFIYYYCAHMTCEMPLHSLVYQKLGWQLKGTWWGEVDLTFLKILNNVACLYIP